MNSITLKKTLLACALSLATATAGAQVKWDMPTGYSAGSFQTQNVQQFADDVAKATGGKLKITLHTNGSLFKANEIKRAVQTGQTQVGEFILSGAANENPLFGIDSIPFLADSYEAARKLADASLPQIGKMLDKQGVKLLFTSPWPGQSLYANKPVEAMSDLNGTKMRAYNPATSRIAQYVGAQPTTIQLAELSQALATGTVENLLTSSASGVEYKLHEHLKYFYPVNAWLPKNAIVANKQAFDALDKPTQDAVLKAAAAAEQRGWRVSEQKDTEFVKLLAEHGMKVAPPSEALRRELKLIGAQMTREWLVNAGADGQAVIDAYRK
ncbi:TRAP transporter substrate-binding protein [Piscinibacter sp.]|uniref:TRAP transporter substrate-binding protein n=1 Tax=Piscinibacter sp. TaxID=1903157 RepID=UPI002B9E8C07|nr:TRAP transporter substrate-binding protein [Albitalea sp.]HUG25127.1 TRAP transporter substrate-binding protein [Albitalea sp.]